ncbi:capsular biosynthesis protein [Sphingomonas sp. Leaf412]|uniref:UDP-2-acetamido-2,6-beta-L-arabino-hexul-4-ose reductase n=1 Tax=Sphingomonas sp. Leaf412 TaxID=1736370 RepID=UPI00070233E2|nr:NAD-dependent epimerase/dehydratase family protein [Sphingomonas sp. Leaf412]KQT31145.1 capsular biosynthesis protein [Sphingomonas sp. Leaf412]
MRTVLVTGSDGFIGRNLCVRLRERGDCDVVPIGRGTSAAELNEAARRADVVFHLAGVNRPSDPAEFQRGNVGFTDTLLQALSRAEKPASIIYTSSTQADLDNPYGRSKRAAEDSLDHHAAATGAVVHSFRLPNVFGKWARPNYNSAVATFCHNVARGLPLTVNDPAAPLRLVYIDDVVDAFIALLDEPLSAGTQIAVAPVYETTVGIVADTIRSFPEGRRTLVIGGVGVGLERALYSTYLSYLMPDDFAYDVTVHGRNDPRGVFVEMLKTPAHGQFSYFIAHPGVTRGDHYHHSKNEKFLVISGTARFAFRHIVTGETHDMIVEGGQGRIVETVPGWTHNISNVGEQDMVCMLWANEIFDPRRPDTFAMKVEA